MKLSTKIALAYLILSFPVVMKGYIGPLIDLVIRLSTNYLPIYLKLHFLSNLFYILFNPPLYIAVHYSSPFSGYLLLFSFVYPFLSMFMISRILSKFD